LYDGLRHARGVAVVAYRTRNILAVTQTDHFEISVQAAANRIEVRKLTA
jgi:hypothetical protein